jgi:hypothetical protein
VVNPRRFLILMLVVLTTLVAVGVVHGLWTERWPEETDQITTEMAQLPLVIGDWGGSPTRDSPAAQALPENARPLARQYVNRQDGTVADILLTRGRPGPMVIKHLPTECYPSNGFEQVDPPKRYLSKSSDTKIPDEFWVATFKKTSDVVPVTLRVYWAWSADGHWQIPDRPRFAFARYSALYKLYVVQSLPNEHVEFEGAPVHDFIKLLTEATRSSLFASPP